MGMTGPFADMWEMMGRRRQEPAEVKRPIRLSDVHPGQRIVAYDQMGRQWGPATIIPEGVHGSWFIALVGMNDAGDLVDMAGPAEYLVHELLPAPQLDTSSCGCGEEGCPGSWPVLERDPHPLELTGPKGGLEVKWMPEGLLARYPPLTDQAMSDLGLLAEPTRNCDDPECCPPKEQQQEEESPPGPPAPGGYL